MSSCRRNAIITVVEPRSIEGHAYNLHYHTLSFDSEPNTLARNGQD